MSYIADDSDKVKAFFNSLNEFIVDKVDNEMTEVLITKYFGNNYSQLTTNRSFIERLFSTFITECLIPEDSAKGYAIDDRLLGQRSKLLKKFVHNYIEYQLNLILVLAEMKFNANWSDVLFDDLMARLHSYGVLTDNASNHWTKCSNESTFSHRVVAIDCCLRLLDWTRETREDLFFEMNHK